MVREMTSMKKEREKTIVLAHGGGGVLTDELVGGVVLPRLGNETLNELLDAGLVDVTAGKLAMTIDGYVVQPLKFPGGDIGRLAISGTVNDLAVSGADVKGIALSLILEEGLQRSVLDAVLESMRAAATEAGVRVITGDTKVVGRGQCDGMFAITAGVGLVPSGRKLHPDLVQPGDAILINGPIADHGLAVMLAREMPDVRSVLQSDVTPLNGLIAAVLEVCGNDVVLMRDPTRGGLSGVAADLARRTGWHVELDEEAIQVRSETEHAAEMLGVDPLDVANEGKVVMVVRQESIDRALAALRAHEKGRQAALIGRVTSEKDGICELRTSIGGRRVLQKPYGEQLPRIC